MGAVASIFNPPKRVLMLGLKNAGKTRLLFKLKLGPINITHSSCNGLEIKECTNAKHNITFTVFDVMNKTFNEWAPKLSSYYHNVVALVWVIDSNDRDTISYNMHTPFSANGISSDLGLHKTLQLLSTKYPSKDIPVLILANKKDNPNTMDCMEICEKLRCNNIKYPWLMHKCEAFLGDGMYEAFEWLGNQLKTDGDKIEDYKINSDEEMWLDAKRFEPKVILFISGWIRYVQSDLKLTTTIPVGVIKLIHEFCQDRRVKYDKSYSYFV